MSFFEDKLEEIERRISKYADILKQTALAGFEKYLDKLAEYFGRADGRGTA